MYGPYEAERAVGGVTLCVSNSIHELEPLSWQEKVHAVGSRFQSSCAVTRSYEVTGDGCANVTVKVTSDVKSSVAQQHLVATLSSTMLLAAMGAVSPALRKVLPPMQ